MGMADVLQDLFVNAEWQEIYRSPDTRLMIVAQDRAFDMLDRDYFDHEDPDGLWPNHWVRAQGFMLPPGYKDDSNQVESIASGYRSARGALTALVESPDHHEHMTGQGFWADHEMFGVGYAARDLERIWVIVTAPRIYTTNLPLILASAMQTGEKLGEFPEVLYMPRVERLIVNP
jgi:hypothetical protein